MRRRGANQAAYRRRRGVYQERRDKHPRRHYEDRHRAQFAPSRSGCQVVEAPIAGDVTRAKSGLCLESSLELLPVRAEASPAQAARKRAAEALTKRFE